MNTKNYQFTFIHNLCLGLTKNIEIQGVLKILNAHHSFYYSFNIILHIKLNNLAINFNCYCENQETIPAIEFLFFERFNSSINTQNEDRI